MVETGRFAGQSGFAVSVTDARNRLRGLQPRDATLFVAECRAVLGVEWERKWFEVEIRLDSGVKVRASYNAVSFDADQARPSNFSVR